MIGGSHVAVMAAVERQDPLAGFGTSSGRVINDGF